MVFSHKKRNFFIASFVVIAAFITVKVQPAHAAVTNTQPTAKVSFTFDDGLASNITTAAPILSKHGYTGTAYIATSCVGMITVPNTCPADPDVPYMSWTQIKSLQNTYGWEIGSHSVTHPELTTVNVTKLESEMATSKAALVAQGFAANAFATPYGDYNDKVLAAAAKYYTSHRGYADTGYNTWPYNNYLIRVQQVQYGVSVATVKSYIDQAKATNSWLVLVFHEIRNVPSTNVDDYQYATADLDAIAAYAQQVSLTNTNVTAGLVKGDTTDNLVSDPATGTALSNGWTTDVAANVKINTASKGSQPEPVRSVAITSSSTKYVHVYSPTVTVNSASSYVIKGYVAMSSTQTGTIGCYIDEYDALGNWISGLYLQTLAGWYTRDIAFGYIPTSDKVVKARLQLIMASAAGKVAYVDSIQWLTTKTGLVIAPPPPDPKPIANNLLTNGTFSSGMTSWTTNAPTTITLDTAGNGSGTEKTNSVKLTNSATANTYLFSQKVAVTNTKTYTVQMYVKVVNYAQDIGFYIDEYDAAGNWISGKYVYTKRDSVTGYISFSYTPTSVNVASSSLQVIMVAGTGTTVYIDDVSWVQN